MTAKPRCLLSLFCILQVDGAALAEPAVERLL